MKLILLYNQYLSIVCLCEFKSIFPDRSIEERGRRIGPGFIYFHGPNLGAIFSCWDGEFVAYANGRNVQLHGWRCKRNGASVCLRVSTHTRDTSVTVSRLSVTFCLRLRMCLCAYSVTVLWHGHAPVFVHLYLCIWDAFDEFLWVCADIFSWISRRIKTIGDDSSDSIHNRRLEYACHFTRSCHDRWPIRYAGTTRLSLV